MVGVIVVCDVCQMTDKRTECNSHEWVSDERDGKDVLRM